MQNIIVFSAILACAVALPAYFLEDNELHYPLGSNSITHNQLVNHGSSYIHAPIIPIVHEISSKKSTLTKSSQVVNHGGTSIVHAPVYHAQYHPVMYSHVVPSKTTVTKSNQVVNHGSSTLVHAPVVPVVHSPVYYSSPVSQLVSVKSGDSATSHHSSTVHETVPTINHLPLYSLHH